VRRPTPVALALVVLLAGSGCVPARSATPKIAEPTAASEWPAAHTRAIAEANESKPAAADRTLAEFAQRFPGSPEAIEVPYWRAVVKLDPNSSAAVRESMAILDSYLATAPTGTHRFEAGVFRRLALAIEQRNAAIAAIPPTPVVRQDDKAREEELQRLRDDLAAANAELARIRRRVARPRP
jgi:hypothetical protein